MARIPSADYVFRVHGIELEGGDGPGVDVQYPGKARLIRYHEEKLSIKSFWLDTYPVTNGQFQKFLSAEHYHPEDDGNFLKDWKNGNFPHGWDNKPVTWVALEDARIRIVVGLGNGCPMNGNGNMPCRERMGVFIRGEMSGTQLPPPSQIKAATSEDRMM